MANSILKLNVESSEYDAKLKKAAEGIRHLADVAHKSGGELTGLEKAELDYIKALGDMETKSRTAAGSVRELENTFKELTVIYNNLNDVEKADEGGKALAASLEKLKQRAIDARAGLNEASQALQTNSEKGGLMGGIMDTLSSKLTFNVDALKLFNAGLQATQAALSVAKDAFFASEANVDEWGRTVQSAQSLYEGFLNAINNGDISGYLSRMGEIVEAARNAYNEMDRLGTMKTIQKPQISKQQAENDRYRSILQTGRWISAADGRKSSLGYKDGDVMSKEHLKIIEQQLQNGMNVIVALHKNEVQQQTKAIDAEYKSMATDLGMSLEEFRKGTSSMAKFDEVVEGARQLHRWEAEHTGEYNPTTRTYSMTAPVPKELEKYRGWDNFRVDGERYNKLADFIQQRDQHMSQIYQMQGQTYRTINRAEGTTVSKIMGNTGAGTGGTKVTPQEQAQKAVEAALLSYNQSIEKAKMSLDNGTATEADTKKKLLSAEEQLWTAYGKAYNIYSDPAYKTAQDESEKKIKELGGEVVNAVEAQKKQEQATRELEAAQKKLADAQRELATARNSGKLGDIYSAEKKVATAQGEVTRLESGQPLAIPDEKTVTIKADVQARIDRTEAIATKPTKTTGGTKVTPQEQAQKAVEAALLSYNQSIEKAKMALDNGTATEADTKKKLLSAEEQLWTAYGKAYAIYSDPAYKTAQEESAKNIKELGGEVVNAVEAQKKQEQATRELEAAQKKLADAQRELATARNSGKLSDIYSAEKKVATAQGEVTRLETIKLNVEKGDIELPDIPQEVSQTINTRVGEVITPDIPDEKTVTIKANTENITPDIPDEKTVTIKANTENITAQISHLKEQMGNLEIGSIDFNKTQENLVDMTTLQSLINTQLKAGLKIDQTVTSDLMQQILGGQNIDDKAWQALVDEINQKLAELELPPIKLNFQTGDVAKDAKAAAKEWQAAGSAIQSVGSAMTQIEDPAAKVLGTVAQAIASVALAAGQAMAAKDTTASGWAWIGAAAAITGTMISTIAAIKSATAGSYAEGGIIPGNKYSGDQQLAWVNSGELILNRSQTNNIANQLQDGTLGNLHLSATVSGEQIRLVLNNNGKRTGRGEYLTTRFS